MQSYSGECPRQTLLVFPERAVQALFGVWFQPLHSSDPVHPVLLFFVIHSGNFTYLAEAPFLC